jgi:hypothetical protein
MFAVENIFWKRQSHLYVIHIFLQNLTISRLPDKRVCYIEPLDKHLPSPRKLKSDMTYVSNKILYMQLLISKKNLAIVHELNIASKQDFIIRITYLRSYGSFRLEVRRHELKKLEHW